MLTTRRAIPRVAGATLVLGGCGGGAEAPGRTAIESAVANICDSLVACDSLTVFYDSLEDCEGEVDAALRGDLDALAAESGAACADAVLAYYTCVAEEYAATCDGDAADDACIDATIAAAEACRATLAPVHAAIAACRAFESCAPASYPSFADCVDLVTLDFEEGEALFEATYDAACGDAYLAYATCWYETYGVACDPSASVPDCDDEFYEFIGNCG